MCAKGLPRNLGDLLVSFRRTALVQRRPGPGRWLVNPEDELSERKHSGAKVPKAEPSKGRGMSEEKSERFTVPTKPGNRPEGTRRREGGAESENRRRERWLADQGQEPSQRNKSG